MNHGGQLSEIGLILGIVLLLILFAITRLVKDFWKTFVKDMILIMLWRHFSGAHYHGKRVTDATWFQPGTTTKRQYDHGGFMDRWEHKRRSHRALWRLGLTFAFFAAIYGLFAARSVTIHSVEALIVYGLVVLGFVIESKVRLRVHNRHVVNPIVKSLAAQLRISEHAVRRLLHIRPEDIKDEGEVGYLELPPEITPGDDQKTSVERIIDAHLPVDIEMDWRMQQAPKLGVIRAGLRPPVEVTWDEMTEAMRAAAYGDIVIGRDRRKDIFAANFIHLEDPHWAFNVQTKRGKSNFLGLVAVQVLHQDPYAQVIAVDPKEESLIDFLGTPWDSAKPLLPGVTMANDPENVEAMWAAIAKARKLMESRRADRAHDRDKTYPICLVILDELNKFCHMTDDAWREVLYDNAQRPKEERENLPKACPVYADIIDILHMGRFVGVHLIAVAQDFRASLLGGEARNGFGLRGLGGFIPSQWKMFIGTSPVPEAQAGVGRWIFWQGERQDWVQITHCDSDKAYAWAATGREQFDERAALGYDDESVRDAPSSFSLFKRRSEATDGHGAEIANARPVIIGLREAARHLGMKPDTFRKARDRWKEDTESDGLPGEFKQGRSPAWYADDLDKWATNRPRAGKGDSGG